MITSRTALLLGGFALGLAGAPGGLAAQGWGPQLQPVTADSPTPAPRKKPSIQAGKTAPKQKPAKAAAPKTPPAAAAVQPAAAPIAAAQPPAPPAEATRSEPAEPAAAVSEALDLEAEMDGGEPQDMFADLRLLQRPVEGEVLTTQVVPSEPNRTVIEAAPADGGVGAQYCTNIADTAAEARLAWQRQNLAEAERDLQQRTAELEAKTAEFQKWLARRDEFSRKAQEKIVNIYAKMRPDAAALQLQVLDDETAAAVLTKLDARVASAVMTEMEPAQAARLTAIISGAARVPAARPRPPAPPPAGNPS